METLSQAGAHFRTKCLTIERAGAFAKCLGENARFANITIETSARAKSASRYFVQFDAANCERMDALRGRQQDARAQRAEQQTFTFCLDKDAGRSFFWCWSHSSGEVYETTEHSCSCPDAEFRCKPNRLLCKHSIALRAADPATIQSY